MTDDRMETITDPAEIRASDEPDERTTPAPVGAAVATPSIVGMVDDLGRPATIYTPPEVLRRDPARWPTPEEFVSEWEQHRPERRLYLAARLLSDAQKVERLDGAIDRARMDRAEAEDAETEATARAESAEAEVRSLRANWRMITTALGFGDGITEPQIGHAEFIAECEREFSEASEWRESQRWRDDCHDAGHPDDEDCYEHDPALVLVTLRARLAAVESLADEWADRKRSDGMSGNAWIGLTLSGVAADLRAALAGTTGEGEHVVREVFTADGIPTPSPTTRKATPMSNNQPTDQIPDDAGLTARVCPHHFDCDGVRCEKYRAELDAWWNERKAARRKMEARNG